MSGVFVVASKYILGMTKINTKTETVVITKTKTVTLTITKTKTMTTFQCYPQVEESSGLFNAQSTSTMSICCKNSATCGLFFVASKV